MNRGGKGNAGGSSNNNANVSNINAGNNNNNNSSSSSDNSNSSSGTSTSPRISAFPMSAFLGGSGSGNTTGGSVGIHPSASVSAANLSKKPAVARTVSNSEQENDEVIIENYFLKDKQFSIQELIRTCLSESPQDEVKGKPFLESMLIESTLMSILLLKQETKIREKANDVTDGLDLLITSVALDSSTTVSTQHIKKINFANIEFEIMTTLRAQFWEFFDQNLDRETRLSIFRRTTKFIQHFSSIFEEHINKETSDVMNGFVAQLNQLQDVHFLELKMDLKFQEQWKALNDQIMKRSQIYRICVEDIDPVELAVQLTLIESEIFQRITKEEILLYCIDHRYDDDVDAHYSDYGPSNNSNIYHHKSREGHRLSSSSSSNNINSNSVSNNNHNHNHHHHNNNNNDTQGSFYHRDSVSSIGSAAGCSRNSLDSLNAVTEGINNDEAHSLYSQQHAEAPNITAFYKSFEQVPKWIASTILQCRSLAQRQKLITKFIQLLQICMSIRSFNVFFEICIALNFPSIQRLQQTWTGISAEDKAKFEKLSKIVFGKDDNYKLYRAEYKKATQPPCIPYLKLHLDDLRKLINACEDSAAATTNGNNSNNSTAATSTTTPDINRDILLNMSTRVKMVSIFKRIEMFQQSGYPFQVNHYVRKYLKSEFSFPDLQLSPEVMKQLSELLEPSEEKKEKMTTQGAPRA